MKHISMKIKFGLAAALLASACTNELSENPTDDARAITFAPLAETRAAVDGTELPSNSSFKVWGGYDNNVNNVFNGVTVTESNGSWSYSGTQYWLPGKKYNFYGVYPNNLKNAQVTNDGITINSFDCSATGDAAIDLMTATITRNGNNPEPIVMPFTHLLSKVNIMATIEGGNATVTNITFSGMTIVGNYSSTNGWSYSITGSFTSNKPKILNSTGVDLLDDMLLIPQTITEDFKIKINYTLDGVEQGPKEVLLPTSISNWEAGQSYKYTLAFKGNNIIFTVNVAPWNHSTGGIITVE